MDDVSRSFKIENMSDNTKKMPGRECLPKTGRVNEVCQEWMVREDSALAYQLQNQEFSEHLSGNKFRNALVREDFPKAKDEQLREQALAEQAAAIYQKMLAEQEEIDKQVAKDLAGRMEKEERMKKRAGEMRDQDIARQLLERERLRVERHSQAPPPLPPPHLSPQKPTSIPFKSTTPSSSPHRPTPVNYQANLPPRRQAMPMPLPLDHVPPPPSLLRTNHLLNHTPDLYVKPFEGRGLQEHHPDLYIEPFDMAHVRNGSSAESYNEPYISSAAHQLTQQLDRIDIVDDDLLTDDGDLGLPLDELRERQLQEERDAEFARKLQEQEGSLEDTILNRDRMMAIEAQDKELAKLLQERERAKAKRARERAKQKSLAKKQQHQQQHMENRPTDQLMPDDSYAFPADLISQPHGSNVPRNIAAFPDIYAVPNPDDEDVSYSLPVDVLPASGQNPGSSLKSTYSPNRSDQNGDVKELNVSMNNGGQSSLEKGASMASRPTHLELRSPLTKINKPRFPDPENVIEITSNATATSPLHSNIAMVIDPTYTRRSSGGTRPSSSYDTTSSTVTTSTGSSSSSMVLPSPAPDQLELDDDSPAPPYMPIQGQRRTASLEKKQKKKSKDGGCKQQ